MTLIFYVLHFDRPLGAAKHYGGSTHLERFDQRMIEHASGNGAAITRRLNDLRIGFTATPVAFLGDRNEEARIKRAKSLKALCPICSIHIDTLLPSRHYASRTMPPRPEVPENLKTHRISLTAKSKT